MSGHKLAVEPEALRASVREKYRHVALEPLGAFHFHTGRPLAARLGYDPRMIAGLPDRAVESFAGVANPFSWRPLCQGDRVVDVGSGGGFDSIVAARLVDGDGRVVGVDMAPEMLADHGRRPASWASATSSSAKASLRTSRSKTARPTS